MTIRTPLITIKRRRPLAYLNYSRVDLSYSQSRLVGRYVLKPDIDLQDYRAKAVIDWVTLRFHFLTSTQFQWVQQVGSGRIGRNLSIEAIDPRPGGVARVFDIRFQEQTLDYIDAVRTELDRKFVLNHEPMVIAAEISVDFKPRQPSGLARAKLYTALTRHFFFNPVLALDGLERPRVTWGRRKWQTRPVIASPHRNPKGDELYLTSDEVDRPPYVDATYYVGAKSASRRWRIMDKVIDQQDPRQGTSVRLTDDEKRVRVEVTLDQSELQNLGVRQLADLLSFKFTTPKEVLQVHAAIVPGYRPASLQPGESNPAVAGEAEGAEVSRQRSDRLKGNG